MVTEPFELQGKRISECFMINSNSAVFIRFYDGSAVTIRPEVLEDEITGNNFNGNRLEIIKE